MRWGCQVREVAVLFARSDSVYKALDGCDVYDIERDARTSPGGSPVVAHPPCRAWGRLRNFAKPRPDEMDLARFAVDRVRTFGGVLEHPEASTLWADQGLPRPGCGFDKFGGWTLPVLQYWWGHKADKATWFYIVGVLPRDIPPIPLVLGEGSHCVCSSSKNKMKARRPELTKAAREHTPPALAEWLVQLARLAKSNA